MNSYKKNVGQRVVAVILTLLLVVTIIPVQAVSAATKKATKVTINNAIEVMNVGTNYTLKSTVAPQSATSKVTYTSSNKKVATVTKDGVIKAKKSGWVTITAKTSNGKKDQCKILVVSKYGYTSLQSKVNLMLKADNIKYITINNPEKETTYKIKLGTYKDKTLAVNAPNSDVSNYAKFKKIKLVDVKNGTWNEFAQGNSFVITDDEFSFNVKRSAIVSSLNVKNTTNATITVDGKVKKLTTSGADSTLNLVVNNEIETIVITEKANLMLSGKADTVNVVVKAGAEGTTIKAENPDVIKLDNQSKEEILVNGENNSSNNTGDNNSNLTPGGSPSGSTGGTSSVNEKLTGEYKNGNTIFTVPAGITVDNVTGLAATATRNTTSITRQFTASELTQIKEIYTMHQTYANKWADASWTGTTKQNESGTAIVTVEGLVNNARKVTVKVTESGKTYKGTAYVTATNAASQFDITAQIDSVNILLKDSVKFTIDTNSRTVTVEDYNLSDNVTIEVTYTR